MYNFPQSLKGILYGLQAGLLCLLLSTSAWSLETDVITGLGDDTQADIAYNEADDEYLVVWENNTSENGRDIYARRVGPTGELLGSAVRINLSGYTHTNPAVTFNNITNEYLIVWVLEFSITDHTILAQKVATDGSIVGSHIPIVYQTALESNPDVAVNSSTGDYLIVWEQLAGADEFIHTDIYARILWPSGLLSSTITVDNTNQSESAPAVTFNRHSGDYLVVYQDRGLAGTSYDISGCLITSSGIRIGAQINIASWDQPLLKPRLAYNHNLNQFLVVWEDHRWSWGEARDIYGQLVDGGGLLNGGNFGISWEDVNRRESPDVAYDSVTGEYFVTWEHEYSITNQDIYTRRVNGAGVLLGADTSLAAGPQMEQQPALAVGARGQFLIVWEDNRFQSSNGLDLYGEFVWATDNLLPTADAGIDLDNILELSSFQLDGSASSDPNNDPLRYRWTQTAGTSAQFVQTNGSEFASPVIIAPQLPDNQPEVLTFTLAIDDYRSSPPFSAQDTVLVRVVLGNDTNPPIAQAGPDQLADENTMVTLDGCTSYDPDGESISYVWTIESVPQDITVQLSDPEICNPVFTTPRFSALNPIDLVFRLRVISERGGVDEDEVSITVSDTINEAPTSVILGGGTVSEYAAITLDGSDSQDPNGDVLSYYWEALSLGDAEVTINSPNSAQTTATASVRGNQDIVIRLTVNDGRGGFHSSETTVSITSQPSQVTDFSPKSGSPGSLVTISGQDLLSVTQVDFNGYTGDIRWNQSTDTALVVQVPTGGLSFYPTGEYDKLGWMHLFWRPSVTTGPVSILGNNLDWTSTSNFEVSHSLVRNVILTQGVQVYPLIQGKDTLLQVQVNTVESTEELAALSYGSCRVIPSVGDPFTVEASHVLPIALARGAVPTTMNEAVNFFLPGTKMNAPSYKFKITIGNGPQGGPWKEVLYLDSQDNSEVFHEAITPHIVLRRALPYVNNLQELDPNFAEGTPDRNTYEKRIVEAMRTVERIYPFAGVDYSFGPGLWKGIDISAPFVPDDWLGAWKACEGCFALQKEGEGNMEQVLRLLPSMASMQNYLHDWNGAGGHPQAMAAVAVIEESINSGTISGYGAAPPQMVKNLVKWSAECDGFFAIFCDIGGSFGSELIDFLNPIDSRVAFTFMDDPDGGSTVAHELGHTLGFVDPYSWNHDDGNPTHCKYDGDEWLYLKDSLWVDSPFRGYSELWKDYYAEQLIFNVTMTDSSGTTTGALFDSTNRATSLMSYDWGKNADNTFLTRLEYGQILNMAQPSGPLSGKGSVSVMDGSFDQKLRLSGSLNLQTEQFTLFDSKPQPVDTLDTDEWPDSPLSLVFEDSLGGILSQSNFAFNLPIDVNFEPSESPGASPLYPMLYFTVVRPMPLGTVRAVISYQGQPIWSRYVSADPPSVTLLAPVGGESMNSNVDFTIRWSAADPDGDDLTYSIYYSHDDGQTFLPLKSGLPTTEYSWNSTGAPGSNVARIKVVASDGFHVGEAVSAPFTVSAAPLQTFIINPQTGAQIPGSLILQMSGECFDAASGRIYADEAFTWHSSIDGNLASGRTAVVEGLSLGVHELTLSCTVDSLTGTDSISVEIAADSDRDGIADDVENATPGLDPNNPHDAASDADGDGVTLASEVQVFGTDPNNFDSDGDGTPDGFEIMWANTDPKDEDTDNDGFNDSEDNCPTMSNTSQSDQDGDGWGDVCDNCPTTHNIDQLDIDADGIGDDCECKPNDLDSDDDGLPDAYEDKNHNGRVDASETDFCNSDSDGDGLSDGLEKGAIVPIADPDGDGPLEGTDLTNFVPDSDPKTQTNPLSPDSDGDGIPDGTEDMDQNGRQDPGEPDPVNEDTDGDGVLDGDDPDPLDGGSNFPWNLYLIPSVSMK